MDFKPFSIFIVFSFFIIFSSCDIKLRKRTLTSKNRYGRRNLPISQKIGTYIIEIDPSYIKGKIPNDHYLQLKKDAFIVMLNDEVTSLDLSPATIVEKYLSEDKTLMDLSHPKVQKEFAKTKMKIQIRVEFLRAKKSYLQVLNSIIGITNVKHVNGRSYVVVLSYNYAHALNAIKDIDECIWIEKKTEMRMKNYGGNSILQGKASTETVDFELWNYGLSGDGEVIAVADTGLDIYNCFFHDPNVPTITPNEVLHNHRKIFYYEDLTSTIGDDQGHGTHVAGSVCGNIQYTTNKDIENQMKYANGIAKNAKIYVQDAGSSLDGIPDDLYTGLFQNPYDMGARIHSNSWGCYNPYLADNCQYDCVCDSDTESICQSLYGKRCCDICNVYDSDSKRIDEFLFDHDEMIILIAAGNDGKYSYSHSVGSPSVCKNGISVGASETTKENYKNFVNITDFLTSAIMWGFDSVEDCCLSDPNNAGCCPYVDYARYDDPIKYKEDNLAYFSGRGPTYDGDRYKPDVVAPGYVISANIMANNNEIHCNYNKYSTPNSLIQQAGTSMATPIIAGLVALIREYFVKGYYPSGIPNENDSLSGMSGYLIKGILIHSGTVLTGSVLLGDFNSRMTLPNTIPNTVYGFGLPKVVKYLKFNNSQHFFKVYDRLSIDHGERNILSYKVVSTNLSIITEFKVTLSYYDRPSSLLLEGSILEEIKLKVLILRNGTFLDINFGNGYEEVKNNIQTVIINGLKMNDIVIIVVNGISITEVINYALIISATLGIVISPTNFSCNSTNDKNSSVCNGIGYCIGNNFCKGECENESCNNRGICSRYNYYCICNDGYGGNLCQYITCNNIIATHDNVCNTHGICNEPNNCTCNEHYYGDNCEITTCFDVPSNNNDVCSTRGQCLSYNLCNCIDGFYGSQCENHSCFGIPSGNSSVCNARGVCESGNICICNDGFYGESCHVSTCNLLFSNDSNVCSGNGICVNSFCECERLYYGNNCQNLKNCVSTHINENFEVSSLNNEFWDSSVSYYNIDGSCEVTLTNSINFFYSAYDVTENKFSSTIIDIQSERIFSLSFWIGIASGSDWKCDTFYNDEYIDLQLEYDSINSPTTVLKQYTHDYNSNNPKKEIILFSVSEPFKIVWRHYTSSYLVGNWGIDSIFLTSENANCTKTCFGIDETLSISCQDGVCIDWDTCNCTSDEYSYGDGCYPLCNGISGDKSDSCGPKKTCVRTNVCECNDGLYGEKCDEYTCDGIESTSSYVCNGHGNCTSPDLCTCYDGYVGRLCETYMCYGITSNEISVCNNHGSCTSQNNCTCNKNYYGIECEFTSCFDIPSNNISTCSNNGNCTSYNTCKCINDYGGKNCKHHMCYGILSSNANVCNGKGVCNGVNSCTCYNGYYGSSCEISICNGVFANDSKAVCNGNGICVNSKCVCENLYYGKNCEKEKSCLFFVNDNFENKTLNSNFWEGDVFEYYFDNSCQITSSNSINFRYFSNNNLVENKVRTILFDIQSENEFLLQFWIGIASGSGLECDTFYDDEYIDLQVEFESENVILKEYRSSNFFRPIFEQFSFTVSEPFRIVWRHYTDTYLAGSFGIDDVLLTADHNNNCIKTCFGFEETDENSCQDGVCIDWDTCSCTSDEFSYGDGCYPLCNGISGDNIDACGVGMKCIGTNMCVCDIGKYRKFKFIFCMYWTRRLYSTRYVYM